MMVRSNEIIYEDELTDMFGEGGKEEVKEYYKVKGIKNMKRNNLDRRIVEDKDLLLEKLKEYPVVSIACKKAGVGRATYYRWFNEDRAFKKQAMSALKEGVLSINDVAEDNLINMVVEKDLSAIKYWLQFHHKDYSRNGYIPVIYAKGNGQ